ncbi:arsenate reductase [Bacillus sp. JCM 19046]|nr:arsenate reductase [Bacillus sp. JCM 19045]GAF18568.1 arsenate reductase [Bacillus sp. JCM 19046]
MSVKLYEYPKCGTCRNAKKWLEQNDVTFEAVHIVDQTPSKERIKELHQKSGLELKSFFNTSGKKYRELDLKNKRNSMSDDEQYELLASDGMLIKRPIVTDETSVTLGFKEEQFKQTWI